jgi:hypothetical protein
MVVLLLNAYEFFLCKIANRRQNQLYSRKLVYGIVVDLEKIATQALQSNLEYFAGVYSD